MHILILALQPIHFVSGGLFMPMTNKLVITITRDTQSYEELYLQLIARSNSNSIDYTYYFHKDLSNCSSNTVRLEFDSYINFIIKARIVNDNSNYKINAFQDLSQDIDLWLLILFSSLIAVVLVLSVLLCIIACL